MVIFFFNLGKDAKVDRTRLDVKLTWTIKIGLYSFFFICTIKPLQCICTN